MDLRKRLREAIMRTADDQAFLKWKRKNVTIRGVKELGSENNGAAALGRGLYTAYLSNKDLAKQYGKIYFVVNAIPKNPKVFNTWNEWEIWFQNYLSYPISKLKGKNYPDSRDFFDVTTIEDEMIKKGYDGIAIKGREIVNFTPPENVIYFQNEIQLRQYYDNSITNNLSENMMLDEVAKTPNDLSDTTGLFVFIESLEYTLVLFDPKTEAVFGMIVINAEGKAFAVGLVAANKGFGPLMYELAMMAASMKGKGLMPDRMGTVTPEAWKVWEIFFNNRNDIEKKTLNPKEKLFNASILDPYADDTEQSNINLNTLTDDEKKQLTIFNTVYFKSSDSNYNKLISTAKEWKKRGFDSSVAFEAGQELWQNS